MTQVVDLALKGLSNREIERRTGVNRLEVARIRAEHDIPPWKPPIPEHGKLGRRRKGCDCTICVDTELKRKRAEYERRGPVPNPLPPERAQELLERSIRLQAETRAAATKTYARWTDEDLAVALDYQHTAAEAAFMLGRSLSAVRHVRRKRGARPDVLPHRPRA